MTLASVDGRGWCQSCGDGGVPLVPATWSPKRFLAIRATYGRGVRAHNRSLAASRTWSYFLPSGWGPAKIAAAVAAGQPVAVKRLRDKSEQEDVWEEIQIQLLPLPAASPRLRSDKPPNRPPKIPAADAKKIQRWANTSGCTEALLIRWVVDRYKVHSRTAQRFLKRHRIKLKKLPHRARKT